MKLFWSKSRELLDLVPKQLKTGYWVFIIKRRPWLRNSFLTLFSVILVVIGLAYYYMFHYTGDLKDGYGQPIDLDKLSHSSFKRSSYIYANNGEMTGRFYEEIRDPIRLSEVPAEVRNGFIAAEDKRFYRGLWGIFEHPGVDPNAIIRAAIGNGLRKLNIKYFKSSGASSIAQQYVRLAYADEVPEFRNREQTLSRKIKEARVAIQITRKYPRDRVFEDFLNMIYFGHGVNGVAEASQRYFGKNIRHDKLNFREIAILVSLNKSPALYCPIFHRPVGNDEKQLAKEIVRLKNARDRYNWVLGRMLDDGYVTVQDRDKAFFKEDEPLELGFLTLKPLKNPSYGYSNRMIKEFLLSEGHTDRELSLYGGLRIYTTIDPRIQKIVSEEFEKHLVKLNEKKKESGFGDRVEGAFIVIDIKTGNILALSGGSNFNETEYNRVMAMRSPGSGFKPFTYAAAIEYFGYDFYSKICNCPLNLPGGKRGERWIPQNFREDNPVPPGYNNLSEMLIRSVNLATLNLARSIGIQFVVELANRMGVWGNPGIVRDSDGEIWFRRPGYQVSGGLDPLLPTAIGSSGVNMLELANAYAVFFRNGVYMRPRLIKEIKSTYDDEVFKIESPVEKRVLSKETAIKMTALMRAVTKVGTAKISMRDIEQQVACKTGTSNGPKDVSIWCGTPELVIAIRFGIDNYKVIERPKYMRDVSHAANMQVTGGWIAGPLARKIIDRIYSERPKVEFSPAIELELQRLLVNPQ